MAGGQDDPQHPGQPPALDRRPRLDQGRGADAAHPALRRRPARPGRLPGVAAMTLAPEAHDVDPEVLEELWHDAPGLVGFLTTVDHKRLGLRYIYTSFAFFFVSGLMALVMRAQLSEAHANVVSAGTYNELMTMHGVTMIFLFNTPILA